MAQRADSEGTAITGPRQNHGFLGGDPKPKRFRWTQEREDTARLTAEGRLTIAEIAHRLSISPRVVSNWRSNEEFRRRVEEYREAYQQDCMERGIGNKHERLRRMNRDWQALQRIQDERSVAPEYAAIAGGKTGNLAHDVKGVGAGEAAQVVDVYEVDTGLLAELRALEKAAAEELGQRVQKSEVDVNAQVAAIFMIPELPKPQQKALEAGSQPSAGGPVAC